MAWQIAFLKIQNKNSFLESSKEIYLILKRVLLCQMVNISLRRSLLFNCWHNTSGHMEK